MKMKIRIFIMIFLLGGLSMLMLSCKDDPETDLDPEVFCDENLCSDDSALKDECIDAFWNCIENEPDVNDDECAATALLICRI